MHTPYCMDKHVCYGLIPSPKHHEKCCMEERISPSLRPMLTKLNRNGEEFYPRNALCRTH